MKWFMIQSMDSPDHQVYLTRAEMRSHAELTIKLMRWCNHMEHRCEYRLIASFSRMPQHWHPSNVEIVHASDRGARSQLPDSHRCSAT